MKYYADKEKKYIGGSNHGQVMDGAAFETDVSPEDWDENTDFSLIDGVELDEKTEQQDGEAVGKLDE